MYLDHPQTLGFLKSKMPVFSQTKPSRHAFQIMTLLVVNFMKGAALGFLEVSRTSGVFLVRFVRNHMRKFG